VELANCPEVTEKPSDVVYSILSDIMAIPSNVHDSIQNQVYDILRKHGQTPALEHLLPKYRLDSRAGYIDIVSLHPVKIGIEVDHSVPRHKSIEKLNFFNGDLSVIVLKGETAGSQHKSVETTKRCIDFKTQYAIINLTQKTMFMSAPIKRENKKH
jgi:hypothetical protein